VNFGTTKYERSVLRKYFLKTAVSDRGSISLVLWCPYFESRFPTVDFQISEMPIELLGSEPIGSQVYFSLLPTLQPTPNNSIGPSEVARDCFKVGWIRLPLEGGRFLKHRTSCKGSLPAPCIKDVQVWSGLERSAGAASTAHLNAPRSCHPLPSHGPVWRTQLASGQGITGAVELQCRTRRGV
jgi:hypothetical protein